MLLAAVSVSIIKNAEPCRIAWPEGEAMLVMWTEGLVTPDQVPVSPPIG